MSGRDHQDYYASTEPDRLMADALEYHNALEPAIYRLIDFHSTWGNSIVIEGWALYPKFVAPLLKRHVSAVWLITDSGLLKKRLIQQPGFLDDRAEVNYLMRSKLHNNMLLQQCLELEMTFIRIDGAEPVGSLADEILKKAAISRNN